MRIMRPWSGFGVVLHTEQRQSLVAQAFERVVVQVHMRQLNFVGVDRLGIDGEVVVVCGDFDLSRTQLLHGMIATVVAELQLESLSAERDAGELMPQADAKNWLAPHQSPDGIYGIRTRLGIAGAVRKENSVRLQREDILR